MSEKNSGRKGAETGKKKSGEGWRKVGRFLKRHWRVSLELRKVILGAPVVLAMLYLAEECRQRLPEMVGINFLASGEFERFVERETAIQDTMAITIFCLACMVLSRKTIYPWLISIFSLLLPVLLIVTNMFPV